MLMEGGSSAKPKQAGNLFDVIKQEMLLLRLNQTKVRHSSQGSQPCKCVHGQQALMPMASTC